MTCLLYETSLAIHPSCCRCIGAGRSVVLHSFWQKDVDINSVLQCFFIRDDDNLVSLSVEEINVWCVALRHYQGFLLVLVTLT